MAICPIQADAQIIENISTTTVKQYIIEKAKEEKVSVDLALYVAEHESRFGEDILGDMDIICNKKDSPNYGKPVRAKGIYQFTDCYWPHITDQQAFDEKFNIDLAMTLLKDKKICIQQFTTCRRYYRENT